MTVSFEDLLDICILALNFYDINGGRLMAARKSGRLAKLLYANRKSNASLDAMDE